MATTINADTVVGGAIVTGDASGQLELQAAGSTKLTVAAGGVTLAAPLPVASGGTGATTLSGITVGTATTATTATNLAGGGAGQVPYQTGAGATAFLAAGTAGQVLQSNGTSAPSWATPGGGSWIFINSTTGSGASDIDVTGMNSTYSMYMIVAQNMSISSSSIFQARFYLGGSLQTSSLYGYVAGVQDTTWTVSAWQNGTDDRTRIADTGYMDTGADYNFVMYLPNVNNTTYPHGYWGSGVRLRNARPTQYFFSGLYNSTGSALTGVRFYMNAGTISGTFRLYGLKNN